MSSINKWIGIGNLTRDPEVRSTQSGSQIVSFSLACNERWKDKNSGEWRDKAEFINVVIFSEGIGKVAASYLKKGSKCYVEGKLSTRKWTDKNGVERYSTEVVLQGFQAQLVMLDSKPAQSGGGNYAEKQASDWDDAPAGDFNDDSFGLDSDSVPF